MLEKLLDRLRDEGPNLPNRFTIALGKRIRDARLEAEMSQSDLADTAYLRQSSVSKIETGMRSVSAEDLIYLSHALDKPILYFFPEDFIGKNEQQQLSQLEQELIDHARKLSRSDLKKLIAQAKALAEFQK